jgi:hypothetical protein
MDCIRGAAAGLDDPNMNEERKARGHKAVTAKHRPGSDSTNIARKQASAMADALKMVKADPAYSSLGQDLRNQIDLLIKRLRLPH